MTFEELNTSLARPAQRALANARIFSFEDLTRFSEREVAQLHGIGRHALQRITLALQETGLYYRTDTQ